MDFDGRLAESLEGIFFLKMVITIDVIPILACIVLVVVLIVRSASATKTMAETEGYLLFNITQGNFLFFLICIVGQILLNSLTGLGISSFLCN
jgi:hypothetical protein